MYVRPDVVEMRTPVPEDRTGEMSVSAQHRVRGGRSMLVSSRGGKKYGWELSIAYAWNLPYQIMNTWNIKQDQVLGNLSSPDTVQLSRSLGERRNTRLEERMELDSQIGEGKR